MKVTKALILSVAAALIITASYAFINLKKTTPETISNTGFAVVELFTSEGCSSCPPADAVVAKLQKESNGKPIYILAFHVDYWNNLGWKDIFSDAGYSKRQRDYAKYLLAQVYTPQVVVNGKTEFVGSEEGHLNNAVKSALQKQALSQITLVNMQTSSKFVQVHYEVKDNGNHSTLLLALIQKTAQSQVKAGENSGHTLSHVQIVRDLKTVPLSINTAGTEKISLPDSFTPQNWEVIGLIQNTTTGEIMGAAKAQFGSAQTKSPVVTNAK
jgi:hypothetical protein